MKDEAGTGHEVRTSHGAATRLPRRFREPGLPMRLAAACALLLLSTAFLACGTVRASEPQVTDFPAGPDLAASDPRKLFPERELVDQSGWNRTDGVEHEAILILEFDGACTEEELRAAREQLERRWGSATLRHGAVEELEIDRRPGWGWFEDRGTSRAYVGVVSYRTATFSIEFSSTLEEHQGDEFLRNHVRSFRRDRGRFARVFLPLLLVSVLLLIACFGRRSSRSSE